MSAPLGGASRARLCAIARPVARRVARGGCVAAVLLAAALALNLGAIQFRMARAPGTRGPALAPPAPGAPAVSVVTPAWAAARADVARLGDGFTRVLYPVLLWRFSQYGEDAHA